MSLYDYFSSLLVGVDLERFDFIVPLLCGTTIAMCVGVVLRAFMAMFDSLFLGRRR